MANVLNHDDSITVTAYSLHEFAFELCDLAAKGYTVSLENSKCPYGGLGGGQYHAILVPRHHYRIELDGTHVNVPKTEETQPEVEVKLSTESKQSVGADKVDVVENTKSANTPKQRTTHKKTT